MSTSPTSSLLAEPLGDAKIEKGTLSYFNARNRYSAYETVISEFRKSGISQATLARRLGKGNDSISRLLSGSGNWTMDTFSSLLFAISGAEVEYKLRRPLVEKLEPQVDASQTVRADLADLQKQNIKGIPSNYIDNFLRQPGPEPQGSELFSSVLDQNVVAFKRVA